MDRIVRFLLVFLNFCFILSNVSAATYTVNIGNDGHLNVVDDKFLSLTVDPRFLFSPNEEHSGTDLKHCMATSLTPAYLRIAGPSTAYMTFHNSTITFTNLNLPLDKDEETEEKEFGTRTQSHTSTSLFLDSQEIGNKRSIETIGIKKKRFDLYVESRKTAHPKRHISPIVRQRTEEQLVVTYFQWRQFTQWAQNAGFDLVFALNNEKRMANGLWDPNTALDILTLANNDNVTKIFWQLGYECRNQSVDDYLNDLETLGAIIQSFPSQNWKTVGGDISKCLSASSKNGFRDYVVFTDQMADAVVLDANSSAHELNNMSEQDRNELLQILGESYTPLWLVDSPHTPSYFEFHRAVDWITSLGYSARNGFTVHFRELVEEEVYQPTLSFYMALMFKHLVGNQVLDVHIESSEAVLFAHCTSLHHMPIPGAVTLFGANLADETARFLVKLSQREDGGDIMQFILGHDLNGDISLNGKPISEDNIRPVVRRVRPYKTLLLNLPPKSLGFWVIANTRLETCLTVSEQDENSGFVEAELVESDNKNPIVTKTKRSLAQVDSGDISLQSIVKKGFKERINAINSNLRNIRNAFDNKEEVLSRKKRQVKDDDRFGKRKLRKFVKKYRNADEPKPRLDFVRKIFGMIPRSEVSRVVRQDKGRKMAKFSKNKTVVNNMGKALHLDEEKAIDDIGNTLNRKRRSLILNENLDSVDKKSEELSTENEIDLETEKEIKLWKILHKIHKQIKDLSLEDDDLDEKKHNKYITQKESDDIDSKEEDQFVVKTKMADDGATINFKEKNKRGLLKSTVKNVVSVLTDLNQNLNRFWNAISLLN